MTDGMHRRGLGLAVLGAALAAPALARAEAPPLMPEVPLAPPRSELVWEAVVELAPTLLLGDGPLGERRMVPITGGVFAGPRIRGRVLPGGADRQLVRRDGVRKLDALYEMQAEDGAVLTVRNRVTVAPRPGQEDYRVSTVEVEAPEGPHGWLNRLAFSGTLHGLRPRPTVLVRVYALTG